VDAILPAASTHSEGCIFCISFLFSPPFFKAFSSLLSDTLHDLLNVNITSSLPFFWSILANVLGVLGAIAIELSAYWAVFYNMPD